MILGIHYLNELSKHLVAMESSQVSMVSEEYVSAFAMSSDQIQQSAVEFTHLVADHCEMIWAKLDLSRSTQEVDVDDATLPNVSENCDSTLTPASKPFKPAFKENEGQCKNTRIDQ